MLMTLFQVPMEDMVIPNGTAVSNAINWNRDYFDAEVFTVQAPTALDALAFTFEVSNDGINYGALQDATGTAIKAPSAQNIAMVYNGVISAINFIRLKAAGNVAADRTFKTIKAFRA